LRQSHTDVGSLEPNIFQEMVIQFRKHDYLPTDMGSMDQTLKS